MKNITPNQLTLARIIAVPIIALLICMKSSITVSLALLLFMAAAATDYYDGYLARKTKEITVFGRIFDAVADKILVISCLLALAYSDQLNNGLIFPALLIVFRELFVTGLREYVAINGKQNDEDDEAVKATKSLQSTDLAKIKTAMQMVAIGLTIPVPYLQGTHPYLGIFAGALLWGSAAIGAYTGYQYWKVVKFTPAKEDM